ncbi:MAG: hypothetical protein DRJ59_07640, partial [Thermoprotei archaeon]
MGVEVERLAHGNMFAVGLGGTGGNVVGTIVEEVKGKTVNFDYVLIDYPQGLQRLKWRPSPDKIIELQLPQYEWIVSEGGFSNFPREAIPQNPELGTGRRRPYSKVTFEYNRKRIKDEIDDRLKKYFKNFRTHGVTCWIFTSLGGGTGSGMFLDFAALLKELREELRYEGRGIFIFLVGILPSGTRDDDAEARLNAIQALRELNYVLEREELFNQVFIVGLHRYAIGGLEEAAETVDRIIAKCILDFCYGVPDINNIITAVDQRKLGAKDKKLLSFSAACYRFPLPEMLELKQLENKFLELRQKEERLLRDKDRYEEPMRACDERIRKLQREINDYRKQIDEARKEEGLLSFIKRIKVKKWEEEIKRREELIKKNEEERKKYEAKIKDVEKDLKKVYEDLAQLRGEIAKVETSLERGQEGAFLVERVSRKEYEREKRRLEELAAKPLNDVVDAVKGAGTFEHRIRERIDTLMRQQPLIVGVERKIPFAVFGKKAPAGLSVPSINPAVVNDSSEEGIRWEIEHGV